MESEHRAEPLEELSRTVERIHRDVMDARQFLDFLFPEDSGKPESPLHRNYSDTRG